MEYLASFDGTSGSVTRDATDNAEELLLAAISESRSLFGRLVAVASVRDCDTGVIKKELANLANRFSAAEVDCVLGRLHREIFENWLQLSIRQQVEDWMENASAVEREQWLGHGQEIGLRAMPQNFKPVERNLFLHDLALVEIITRDQEKCGGA